MPAVTALSSAVVIDRSELMGSVALGLVPLLLALVVAGAVRWRSRDEIFADVTPGLIPTGRTDSRRRRLRSGEWSGTVAVAFTPPPGVTPGVAGTVIDGVADPHDVSATIVDLAVRGWFRIEEVARPAGAAAGAKGASGKRGWGTTKGAAGKKGLGGRDWVLHRAEHDPAESLTGFERTLVTNLFLDAADVDGAGTGGRPGTSGPTAGARSVRLSQLHGSFAMTMRRAQIGLYREVVDRGWYRRHPRAKNARARLVGLVITVPLALVAIALVLRAGLVDRDWSFLPLAVGALLAAFVLGRWGRGRTPRTAEGTAVRIQTLGFRHYLETAEADQITFEEAGALFSRYLPWAMAFGIAEAWARLFGEVAAQARLAGYTDAFWELAWFEAVDLAGHSALLIGDLASAVDLGGLGDLSGLADAGGIGDLGDVTAGMGDALEGVAGTVGSVGDFTESASGLFHFDGLLDGCDGCDAPGCDL